MKKLIKIVLVLLVLMFIISKCSDDSDDSSDNTNNQNVTNNQSNSNNNKNNNSDVESNANQSLGDSELDAAILQIRQEAESVFGDEYDSYEYKGYDSYKKILTYEAVKYSSVGTYTARIKVLTGLYKGKYEYAWNTIDSSCIYEVHDAAFPKIELDIAGTWKYSSGDKDFKVIISDEYTTNDFKVVIPVEYTLDGYGDSGSYVESDGKESWYSGRTFHIDDKVYLYETNQLMQLRRKELGKDLTQPGGIKIYVYLFDTDEYSAGLVLDGCQLRRN